ncbi:MAG: 50S ribosomal protein L22 [Caldicoprobacter oshimai]|uniref:Large ribosomal subunit protein uL22 n=1 Tax=Caldicoprobacter faecalis TaxID=937334 RepID=A0A1I5TYP2_9FIRM|nr:50S ribosomal protein L22 [Caldicoprobacter faecalis]PZN10476.1 MAG: 50S ribosomal protein L22 [Caldicoprobacter oshimai]SFP88182.1 LSU ribosomal protein L22P [Caldicoprobacter faecalis]
MATRIREKAKAREQNKDTRPRAIARYIRMSPRKVRAVIDLIRGKTVNEALAILANTPRAAARPVMKVLKSAIANAENNMNMSQDNLYVAEIYADQGPTLKRIRPRARGMAYMIRKRTSHITVVLDEIKK